MRTGIDVCHETTCCQQFLIHLWFDPQHTEMATRQLATWISTLEYTDLPETVVQAAVHSFQNSLGCIIGGSSHPTVKRAINSIQATGTGKDNDTSHGQ